MSNGVRRLVHLLWERHFAVGIKVLAQPIFVRGFAPSMAGASCAPSFFFEWPVRLAPAVPLVGARRVLEEGLWKIILDIFNGIP